MRILYTLTIFLSSALLFLVQPMVARIILPAYGGTAAVWTSSELFFQATLLLGYGYAHFSARRLGSRKQPLLHLPLMAAGLLTLPFATRVAVGAEGEQMPVLRLLGQLALMVGLTFFVVSAGAPLIQRWFADTGDKHAHDPYFLYSASNLGSMVALIAYPVLIEPRLRLSQQAALWAGGYVALIVMMAVCAFALSRSRGSTVSIPALNAEPEEPVVGDVPITREDRLRWIVLSAVPSSLLLGVTAYISTNVAPIPLMWVVPLALYLLTFIFAFAKRPLLGSKPLGRVVPMIVTPLAVAIVMEAFQPALAFLHLAAFFLTAWMCHTRLSESRPRAAHLTEFYFYMSLGGVLGGAFNALVAPVIFNTLFEYPLALIAAGMLIPPYRADTRYGRKDLLFPIGIGLVTIVIAYGTKFGGMPPSTVRTGITVGLPAVLCFFAVDRPVRFGLSLAAMILVANAVGVASDAKVVLSERSFFGVHRVLFYGPHDRYHRLTHGNTLHGIQDRDNPRLPLTYYHPTGPIGHVFKGYQGSGRLKNVALVGLGVGSLAAYGEPGQNLTFFEIDPTVRKLATDPKLFSFIHDSRANVNIVMGDARLRLSQEPDGKYDMIVLDAFSSDAVPVHLLTREAAEMYFRKLKPGGLVVYHISNRYLDLQLVLHGIARDLHLAAFSFEDAASPAELEMGKMHSNWLMLVRRPTDLGALSKDGYWSQDDFEPEAHAWTDDFSNVLEVFREE